MRLVCLELVILLIDAVASFCALRRPLTARISCLDPSSFFAAVTPPTDDDASPSSADECSCGTSFLESSKEDDEPMEEISPFYRRDTRDNPDALQLPPLTDPAGLASLLEERYHARQSQDYLLVSDLDRQLKQKFAVKAYDHPPVWTRLLSSPPTAFRRRQAQKQKRLMERAFGPAGHPYRQLLASERRSDHVIFCDLTMAEIHALLCRRTQCRVSARYEEADAVRLELSIHGVRVCDETLQWTTDPTVDFDGNKRQTESIKRQQHQRTSTVKKIQHYIRDPLSRPFEDEPIRFQQRVEQLVQARSDALVRGEFELAESLALELYCSYDVGVNDHTNTWSVGCQFLADASSLSEWNPPLQQTMDTRNSEKKEETYNIQFPSSRLLFGDKERNFGSETRYRCSSQSLPVPKQFKQRIEDLVQDRIHKREEARFLEADAVRKELWHAYVSYFVCSGRLGCV